MRPVYWSLDARRDQLEIARYLAEDNANAAERVARAIAEAGNKLGEFATGRPGRVAETYEKHLSQYPYIVAYQLREYAGRGSVIIVRVIHMSRDWPNDEWPSQ